ncbi:MAG: hypothetical protein AB1734_04060 [Elusimicrobiota bacterium]|jgi:hypothetical protein
MIEDSEDIFDASVKFHDRHRFEIKLEMDLADVPKAEFDMEAYFFVPKALNISPQTYSKERFYGDMQRYVRFQIPRMSLAKIADGSNALSPLYRIRAALSRLRAGERDPGLVPLLYDEFKLLGCIIRGELRDGARLFISVLGRGENPRPGVFLAEGLDNLVMDLHSLSSALSSLKREVTDSSVPLRIRETAAYFDEYRSLTLEEYLAALVAALRRAGVGTPSCDPRLSAAEKQLAGLAAEQEGYRRAMGYPSVYEKADGGETLIYRRGVLKKFISSALYLKAEVEEWTTMSQLGPGIAAGVAMLFAVAATIYAQSRYALNSAAFVMIVVVSYIFKDRIKDWLKVFFSRSMAKWLYDRRSEILTPRDDIRIGEMREAFTFLKPGDVPADILDLRNIDNITSIDEDGKPERVFKYKKEMILKPRLIGKLHDRRKDLNDIIRFNITEFVKQADDTRADYTRVAPDGTLLSSSCPRVYRLNLVLRYSYRGRDGATRVNRERIRVVLNKEGIVRMEEVRAA